MKPDASSIRNERRRRLLKAPANHMVNLFVYGTLMDDDLVEELTGRRFRKEAAALAGYRRVTPEGGFPFIVPNSKAVVHGFLLYELDAEALRGLDRYEDEGHLYRRTTVVVSSGGREQPCMTYVGIAAALLGQHL